MAKERKRILLSVDKDLFELIEATEGMGTADAEKVVNIVRAYFSEKSVISTKLKKKLNLQ